MKSLLRFYPPSWRRRYGNEMDALLDEVPTKPGVALDLLLGATAAYGDVIRANRILSAMGAYIHGVCVAVLVQATAFVGLILVAQGSNNSTEAWLGPIHLATVMRPMFLNEFGPAMLIARRWPELEGLIALACLALLGGFLVLVLRGPRWVRTALS